MVGVNAEWVRFSVEGMGVIEDKIEGKWPKSGIFKMRKGWHYILRICNIMSTGYELEVVYISFFSILPYQRMYGKLNKGRRRRGKRRKS